MRLKRSEDSRDLAGEQRPGTKVILQRPFWTNVGVLEPSKEQGVSGRVGAHSHRGQICNVYIGSHRRESARDPQSHQTQHATHNGHTRSPACGFEQPLKVAQGYDAAPSDVVQVEPGESNVPDVLPFLEVVEIWCNESLIGGVLDPIHSRFVGCGHG